MPKGDNGRAEKRKYIYTYVNIYIYEKNKSTQPQMVNLLC